MQECFLHKRSLEICKTTYQKVIFCCNAHIYVKFMHNAKDHKQQEESLRTPRCKIRGVFGLYAQKLPDPIVFFCAQWMIPSYCVFQPPFRLLCEVFYCARCGPLCLCKIGSVCYFGWVKALTDLPSSTSSTAPDV